jgi:hypothetical protein
MQGTAAVAAAAVLATGIAYSGLARGPVAQRVQSRPTSPVRSTASQRIFSHDAQQATSAQKHWHPV